MPGSSLRNSIHRRNHKERSQPAARAKWGLLEKHKDYVLRARNYASKKQRLATLARKASFRNEDEFYHAMAGQRTKGGVHLAKRAGEGSLPVDVVKMLKTQDVGYVRTQVSVDRKRIALLRSQLQELADLLPAGHDDDDDDNDDDNEGDMDVLIKHGVLPPRPADSKGKGKGKAKMPYRPDQLAKTGHVVFVDDIDDAHARAAAAGSASSPDDEDEQQDQRRSSSKTAATPLNGAQDDDDADDLGWVDASDPSGKLARRQLRREQKRDAASSTPALSLEELAAEQARLDAELEQAAAMHRRRLLAELAGRLRRVENLEEIARHMDLQRKMMGKGGVRRVERRSRSGGENAAEEEKEVHPEDEMEDARFTETGGKLGWKTKVVKWKAERRR